jgi:hypothetical protein
MPRWRATGHATKSPKILEARIPGIRLLGIQLRGTEVQGRETPSSSSSG